MGHDDNPLWHLVQSHPVSTVWVILAAVAEAALFVKEIVTW